eukprot:365886-Chlamydomonas_euryale.AAC.8
MERMALGASAMYINDTQNDRPSLHCARIRLHQLIPKHPLNLASSMSIARSLQTTGHSASPHIFSLTFPHTKEAEVSRRNARHAQSPTKHALHTAPPTLTFHTTEAEMSEEERSLRSELHQARIELRALQKQRGDIDKFARPGIDFGPDMSFFPAALECVGLSVQGGGGGEEGFGVVQGGEVQAQYSPLW